MTTTTATFPGRLQSHRRQPQLAAGDPQRPARPTDVKILSNPSLVVLDNEVATWKWATRCRCRPAAPRAELQQRRRQHDRLQGHRPRPARAAAGEFQRHGPARRRSGDQQRARKNSNISSFDADGVFATTRSRVRDFRPKRSDGLWLSRGLISRDPDRLALRRADTRSIALCRRRLPERPENPRCEPNSSC